MLFTNNKLFYGHLDARCTYQTFSLSMTTKKYYFYPKVIPMIGRVSCNWYVRILSLILIRKNLEFIKLNIILFHVIVVAITNLLTIPSTDTSYRRTS